MREMKDSGIEWIGKIPAHWALSKVGMFYNIVLGKMLQSEQSSDSDTYEKYLCAMNLGNNALKYDVLKKMWFSEKERQQYKVQKGDLIVVEGGDVASCDIVKEDVSDLYIQNALHRVRAKKDFTLEFLRYSLMMAKAQGYISLICNKATIAHFTKDKFSSLPFLAVPVDEQLKIVQVLDKKCAQVDALITNIQTQIEKLKAYKQSMITEVVTKGLDPTVPMKDSGVEWIGEIPAHWEITRKLAFVTTEGISYGIVKLFDPDDVNGVKVLRCSDVLEGWIKPDNIRTVMQEVSNEYARTILFGGEVVVNVRGSLGGCAVVPKTMAGYNIAREVAKIALNDSMCNRYVMYYLLSRCFVEYRTSRLSGSVYVGLNIELLSSCPLPNPDLAEQTAIADYLDEKCSQIDRLIAIKQAKIEKLEQYKRSLIYEYVTGKREVS